MAVVKRYRKMAFWSAPTALVDAVRLNGINLLIGAAAISALGQFSIAWKTVQVPTSLIGAALAQVFFQKLSTTRPGHMTRAVWRSIGITGSIGLPIFGAVWLLAPTVIPIIYGPDWLEAAHYVRALVPWVYMTLLTSPISTVLVVIEKQQLAFMVSLVYAAVPLTLLAMMARVDALAAIQMMSLAMTAILVADIVVILYAARNFDRNAAPEAETER